MKTRLEKPKDIDRTALVWTESKPFLENALAVLIHRPRTVVIYSTLRYPHLAVHAWCGNSFTGTDKFTFLDEPPEGRVICERCEKAAIEAGENSSDEIVGRHVHIGRVRPQITCCPWVKCEEDH